MFLPEKVIQLVVLWTQQTLAVADTQARKQSHKREEFQTRQTPAGVTSRLSHISLFYGSRWNGRTARYL